MLDAAHLLARRRAEAEVCRSETAAAATVTRSIRHGGARPGAAPLLSPRNEAARSRWNANRARG